MKLTRCETFQDRWRCYRRYVNNWSWRHGGDTNMYARSPGTPSFSSKNLKSAALYFSFRSWSMLSKLFWGLDPNVRSRLYRSGSHHLRSWGGTQVRMCLWRSGIHCKSNSLKCNPQASREALLRANAGWSCPEHRSGMRNRRRNRPLRTLGGIVLGWRPGHWSLFREMASWATEVWCTVEDWRQEWIPGIMDRDPRY